MPQGARPLRPAALQAILVTALAEAPGVLAAASLIDTKGRKWTLRAALLVCSAAMLSLVAGPPHSWQLPLLFMARASIQASYSTLYCYAPEVSLPAGP